MSAVAENKGFHPFLQEDHPYIFIDSCMQAWPDADYANAHLHGVTAYAVTAWRPHATIAQALGRGYVLAPDGTSARQHHRGGDGG